MTADALLAYLHCIAIFIFFGFLTAAFMQMRGRIDAGTVRSLKRCDAWIGAAAGATLVTGLLRLFAGAKGVAFYVNNPVFWAKVAVFVIVGLMAIPTGKALGRWVRAAQADASFVADESEQRVMKKRVLLQIHLLALVPLAAVFMARGLGL